MRALRSALAAAGLLAATASTALARDTSADLLRRLEASEAKMQREIENIYRDKHRNYLAHGGHDDFETWKRKLVTSFYDLRKNTDESTYYVSSPQIGFNGHPPQGGADQVDLIHGVAGMRGPLWMNPYGAHADNHRCSYYLSKREDGTSVWRCAE